MFLTTMGDLQGTRQSVSTGGGGGHVEERVHAKALTIPCPASSCLVSLLRDLEAGNGTIPGSNKKAAAFVW